MSDDEGLDGKDFSGCLIMEDTDPPVPYCRVATRVAVRRKAMLDAAHATAADALEQLDDPEIGDKFVRHNLRVILESTDDTDPGSELGVVTYDELLLALVDELDEAITTDAKALLEIAQRAAHTLTGQGWLVVRPDYLRG